MFSKRNTQVSVKKSCKFCKDSGKSEEEYMSHFLRETKDPNSRITCPTLLAIECRYCFKKGHTVSKCAKLLKEKNGVQKKIPSAPIKKAWSGNTRVMEVNHFDLLSDFGDSDVEEEVDSNASTSSMCMDCDTSASGSSDNSDSKMTYAQMLAKPVSFSVDSPNGLSMENLRFAPPGGSAKRSVVVNVPAAAAMVGSRMSILNKARLMRSWADFSDSDEE